MSDKNQKLVLSILDFLESSIKDGTVKADDREGLEVAGTFVMLSKWWMLSTFDPLN